LILLEVEELTVIGMAFEEHQDRKCHVYCNILSSRHTQSCSTVISVIIGGSAPCNPLTILRQQVCRHRRPEFSKIA